MQTMACRQYAAHLILMHWKKILNNNTAPTETECHLNVFTLAHRYSCVTVCISCMLCCDLCSIYPTVTQHSLRKIIFKTLHVTQLSLRVLFPCKSHWLTNSAQREHLISAFFLLIEFDNEACFTDVKQPQLD